MGENSIKAGWRVVKAGRKLKEEAAHLTAEEVADMTEVADERLRSVKTFDVRDEFGGLDRINKIPTTDLPDPRSDVGSGRPRVKRGVQLNGFEVGSIMSKPCRGR